MQRVAWGVSGTVCILSLVVIAGAAAQSSRPSDAPSKIELLRYLREHPETPEKYVVGKFTQYDVVFMGEWHRIRHDVQLVHRLIPKLYRAGVRHLGIEFGNYEDQDLVDQLITADTYDERLARKLMFRYFVWWGYREYQDIYRKAWEFNRRVAGDSSQVPCGQPPLPHPLGPSPARNDTRAEAACLPQRELG